MSERSTTAADALTAILALFDRADRGEVWVTRAQRRILNQAAEVLAQLVVWEA